MLNQNMSRQVKKAEPVTAKPNGKNVFALDDGTREITLVNSYNKVICRIHFRPSDISIMDRYNTLTKDFDKITAPLKQIDINPDGTTDENIEDNWAILKKVEGELIQRINALLDSDDANEIFSVRNAFSSINGKFFVEHVIEMLGNVISAYLEEEAELTKARITPYTEDVDNEVNADAGTVADNA